MSLNSLLKALTAALLASSASAHMIMDQPVMYNQKDSSKDNGPVTASTFPCKSQFGFTVTKENQMAVGTKQNLSFKGTAVHGGGSCQLSVTLDRTPTANSVFKVIKSIEGGCPGVEGGPNAYEFELPASIPNGKATFAWTWFAELSGAPEMYMNCGPIEVTGGASDKTAFNALPDMFVANIGSTTCRSPQNKDVQFPNPGSVVERGSTAKLAPPTGECGASSGGGSQPPSGGASSSAPAPTSQTQGGTVPTNTGGVFAPSASSTDVVVPVPTSSPAEPTTQAPEPTSFFPTATSVVTTLITRTASTGVAPAPTSGSPGGGSGTSCSNDGAVVCNGPTQFGLCNHGSVVWQQVAAGTQCINGVISKRSVVRRSFGGRFLRAL